MKQATPATRDLARLLLALEADGSEDAENQARAALSIFEKLRVYLSKLVGTAGFHSLLARALTLAKTEANGSEAGGLEAVELQADGTLAGFSETALRQPGDAATAGRAALIAQFLGLLVTFIGEALTLRLVEDVWPLAKSGDKNLDGEDTPV